MSTHRPCECCGAIGPIHSRRTGIELCRRCYRYPERSCGGCGRIAVIKNRASDSTPDLCARCYPGPRVVCVVCGAEAVCRYLREGTPTCERCILEKRIRQLVTRSDGEVPEWAEPIERALLSTKNPQTMFVWLRRSEGAQVLRRLVASELPLTHDALDVLGRNKAVAHLRELLVAAGALSWRDPYIARVEASVRRTVAAVDGDGHKYLESYVRWRVMPWFRSRSEQGKVTSSSVENTARTVNEIGRFLTWLNEREIRVHACSQSDIELWLSDGKLTRRLVRDFVKWMTARGYMRDLFVPALAGSRQPASASDEGARWALARRLLHENELDVADRVAGILVLLYAQRVSRIAQLTKKEVTDIEEGMTIRLGRNPVAVPEDLARLVRRLPQQRRRGSSAYLSDPDHWLFPGGRAGQPVSRSHLSQRLRATGVDIRSARNGALLQLAGEVPPVVLADLLGISISNAVRWVEGASGQWSTYANRSNTDGSVAGCQTVIDPKRDTEFFSDEPQ